MMYKRNIALSVKNCYDKYYNQLCTKINIILNNKVINVTNISEISGFIWGIADSVLRGAYKRNEYQKFLVQYLFPNCQLMDYQSDLIR